VSAGGGGEEEEGEDEEVDVRGEEEVQGRPIPPVPSTWDRLLVQFEGWGTELHRLIFNQPAVAGALLLMGVLVGIILTLLAFTLNLEKGPPPPRYAPIPTATAGSKGAEITNKPVKGE